MKTAQPKRRTVAIEAEEPIECVDYGFGVSRRTFVKVLGAGLVIAAAPTPSLAQRRGGRGSRRDRELSARLHVGEDGVVTVLTGKVEVGQGSRAELTQAAAEELRLPVDRIRLVMSDTGIVPDDGITAGSRSTPSTVPIIRRAAAAARNLLEQTARKRWGSENGNLVTRDGKISASDGKRTLTYGDLARGEDLEELFQQAVPPDVKVTPVSEWKVLGTPVPRPNARDLVTGAHRYSSDIELPGMLRGKVLRAPTYGATLVSVDLAPAEAMPGVTAVRDGQFVGVAAPNTTLAEKALAAVAATAKWEPARMPSSAQLFDYLREHARGGVPENPFADELAKAKQTLRQTYRVPYVQHAPMETRAAVAEWEDGKLTVWAGTQNPFGFRRELERTFHLSDQNVRVIVPDTGGGFGGKHTGEVAVEAARLAQAAGKAVSLKWTRVEEFTWAYFRPAAVIDIEATLDATGKLTSWHFVSINPGRAGVETPYRIASERSRDISSEPPLRQGSYRALGSTANNFARESFMDELATAAGADPLEFRLAHLENDRLRAVLQEATKRFNWSERAKDKRKDVGVGLACGTEKGSYVAACVEIGIDRARKQIAVKHVCEAFECGAIINPANLQAQVEGAIIMGLGPALREVMRFENGEMLNPRFYEYLVPRFPDVPALDLHLLNRPDLPSVGAGETPIIAVAPAIANAVFQATGRRVPEMPIQLGAA